MAVGLFNTALGYACFVLVEMTFGPALKSVIQPELSSVIVLLVSHLIASGPAFVLYRHFVFRVSGQVAKDFLRFQSVYLLPLTLNAIALPGLVWLGLNVIFAQALILIVSVTSSYFGHRNFSFKRSKDVRTPTD